MKSIRIGGWAVLGLLSLLSASACSLLPGQQAAPSPSGGAARARPAVVVSVTQAKVGKIASVLAYSGNIQSRTQVNVVPRTSGRIEKVLVDVGSVVKAGDVLAELDHTTLDAQLRQAEANVAAVQARIDGMKAGGRPEDVASSEAQVRSAQARLDLVKRGATDADVQAAQGSVVAAQSRLEKARSDLAKLKNPPTPDELTTYKAALEKAAAALQKAQAEYDRVSYRRDLASLTQATALQQATIDHQTAQANLNIRLSPRAEDVAAAERAATSAEADVTTAQARLDQLKKGPTDEDVTIADASLQQALNQLAMKKNPYTEADVKSAQASMAQAQAALEVARAQRSDANIVAPFDGIVAQKLLSEGALATANSAVVTLVSPQVELTLSVEEARVSQFRAGQSVALSVPSYPGQGFSGKVMGISPTADPKSRTFVVRVAPDAHDGRLKAGMYAEVQITVEQKEEAVLVPREAVTQKAGQSLIYVVADGQARARDVKLGIVDDKIVEVVSGVGAGDQVVIAGFAALNDGDSVRIAGQLDQQQGSPGKTGKPGGAGQSKEKAKP